MSLQSRALRNNCRPTRAAHDRASAKRSARAKLIQQKLHFKHRSKILYYCPLNFFCKHTVTRVCLPFIADMAMVTCSVWRATRHVYDGTLGWSERLLKEFSILGAVVVYHPWYSATSVGGLKDFILFLSGLSGRYTRFSHSCHSLWGFDHRRRWRWLGLTYALLRSAIIFLLALMMPAICSAYSHTPLANALHWMIEKSLSEISTVAIVLPPIVAVNTSVSSLR